MRILQHDATVFVGNGIKFGVGNMGINVRHYFGLYWNTAYLFDVHYADTFQNSIFILFFLYHEK